MLSGPHSPPARRPCECRPHASSPQRCSSSGARSPGPPQTGAQAVSTDGACRREPLARRAQPSRPSRARADCVSLPLSGPVPPPHAQPSNQSAAARAGPLGGCSPTVDLELGLLVRSGERVPGTEWRGSGSLASPRGDLGSASRCAWPPCWEDGHLTNQCTC